jgi:hypothetical protein
MREIGFMATTAHSGDERVTCMVFRRIRVTCSNIEVGWPTWNRSDE